MIDTAELLAAVEWCDQVEALTPREASFREKAIQFSQAKTALAFSRGQIRELIRENAALRAKLEAAPHGEYCNTNPYGRTDGRGRCNCWKASL